MKTDFRISVAMCTCNGSRFIKKQINSILSQSVMIDELVICDDMSDDNTVDIICDLLEECSISHKIIVNSERLGITKNFEKCIGLCSGDIIFLSDQDDEWMKNKVEVMISPFKDENVILVFSDARVVTKNQKVVYESLIEHTWFGKDLTSIIDSLIRKQQSIYGCLMAFRKELYYLSIPFVNTDFYHDGWLGINAILNGTIVFKSNRLVDYCISDSSITQSKKGQDKWYDNFWGGDTYDRRFTLNLYREQRVQLMKSAILRNKQNRNNKRTLRMMRKSVELYNTLIKIKKRSRWLKVHYLLLSFFDGSYYYRNTNRNEDNGFTKRLKLFCSDIIFLVFDKS